MTKRFAVKIAYIGRKYQGFQRQDDKIPTIEKEIINTLIDLDIIKDASQARYSAAGRTDAGVSALGQVIVFDSLKEQVVLEEINQFLPRDIYAWAIAEVEEEFHARRNAIQRTYKYFIPHNNENIRRMKKSLKKLLGKHDFTKFCKKSEILPSGILKSTILTLEQAKLLYHKKFKLLEFEFTAKSFLWKQVRKMVSLVLDIGKKNYPIEIIDKAFDSTSREPIGGIEPKPAEGLILYNVQYPKIQFKTINKKSLIENKLIIEFNAACSIYAVLNRLKKDLL